MSRNRSWEYEIAAPRTRERDALWEKLFWQPYAIVTRRILSGGGCVPGAVHVWLYCNKTKARRVAERLDAYFGTTGTLRDVTDDYGDDE